MNVAILFVLKYVIKTNKAARAWHTEHVVNLDSIVVPTTETEFKRLRMASRKVSDVLNGVKRPWAILMVDIVKSANLKKGGRQKDIDDTFEHYDEWTTNILRQHRVKLDLEQEILRTPDGFVAPFDSIVNAFNAMRAIVEGLSQFNAKYNQLKRAGMVQVRAGLALAEVPLLKGTPLHKAAYLGMDFVGHLEKRAEPMTMLVGEDAAEALPKAIRSSIVLTNIVIEEYPNKKIYLWKSEEQSSEEGC